MVNVKHHPSSGRPMTPIPTYILSDQDNSMNGTININTATSKDDSNDLIDKLIKGVEVLKGKVGDVHLDVAIAIDAVGTACCDKQDFDTAIHHFNEALSMKKETLAHLHHPSIADTLRSLGEATHKNGLVEESEGYYKEAYGIYREAFDDRSWTESSSSSSKIPQESKEQIDYDLHQMISKTLVHLGSIYYENRDYEKALKYYQDAQKEAKMSAVDAVILDRHHSFPEGKKSDEDMTFLKETRLFISIIMNNIANIYAQQKNTTLAIQTYNSALNIQMSEVGEDHLSVSSTLHNMGTMHYQNGEYNLSLKCYKQVLKMRRFLLGNEHPSIADALMNIAIVHEKEGELDKAESALNATIRVITKVYSENDFRIGFVQDCLGALNARNGYELDALACFSKALNVYQSSDVGLDDDHPLVSSTKKSMEYVRKKQNGGDDSSDEGDNKLMMKDEVYDIMSSFLSCGGFCFMSNSADMKHATMQVLV